MIGALVLNAGHEWVLRAKGLQADLEGLMMHRQSFCELGLLPVHSCHAAHTKLQWADANIPREKNRGLLVLCDSHKRVFEASLFLCNAQAFSEACQCLRQGS